MQYDTGSALGLSAEVLHTCNTIQAVHYSLSALSCRDNFPVCVYEPAHQHCKALRHYFISWSCDCHTFVNPLRNAISVHVCLSSLSYFFRNHHIYKGLHLAKLL